jgi:hypothetical protein
MKPSCSELAQDESKPKADVIRRISYGGIAIPIIYLIISIVIYPQGAEPGDFAAETISQQVVVIFFIVPPIGLVGLTLACVFCVFIIDTLLRIFIWLYIRNQSCKPLDPVEITYGEELISEGHKTNSNPSDEQNQDKN